MNAGSHSVVEDGTPIAGYTTTYYNCSNVSVANGGTQTCTITNNDQPGTLIVKKLVINDNGGTKIATNFKFKVNGGTATSFTQDGADTLKGLNSLTVNASTYNVVEDGTPIAGYTTTYDSCSSIAVGNGQTKTCTITNNDQPGTIVIIKNAKPAQGVFAFDTTGSTSGTGTSWPTGASAFTLTGSTASNGNTRTFTVDVGTYTVKEQTQLSWTLTGIGGSSDPLAPYDCVVTGGGGSTGGGIAPSGQTPLDTRTVSIAIKNGDTVTCTFENTGNGATRTQGFWATHPQLAAIAWNGGGGFGHTFPGVAGTPGIGDATVCGDALTINAAVNALAGNSSLMGGFWSDISKTTNGKKRSALNQAKMQLLQQLLAAELNGSAFGSVPGSGSFTAWETALCGSDLNAIKTAQQQAASFNSQGDNSTFTPGTSAQSKFARFIANLLYWDKFGS